MSGIFWLKSALPELAVGFYGWHSANHEFYLKISSLKKGIGIFWIFSSTDPLAVGFYGWHSANHEFYLKISSLKTRLTKN